MKPIYKKLLSIAIFLALLALALNYLIKNIDEFKEISLQNPWLLIPIAFLFILNYFFIGFMLDVLMGSFKVKMSLKESFQLSIVTGFYNLITPFRGGMAARAVYLKKKYKFSYTNFLATLAASYVLIFLVASVIGMLSLWSIHETTGQFSIIIFLVFLAFIIPLLLTVIFSPKIPETKHNWINRFIRVINGWHLIKNNKRVIFTTLLFSFLQLLSSALSLYLSFKVLGISIPYASILFISSLGTLGILISITPAGLGISEAITVFSALTIGINPTQSLSVAILGRIVQIAVMFILGPIFSYKLLKKIPKNEKNTRK